MRSMRPIIAKEHGCMISYGQIYQSAESHPLFANANIIDILLIHMEEGGILQIIRDPDCSSMILGVQLK